MESSQSIFEKVEELFLNYGIKSITMDDISKELGISKKTLYQFVENKTDLINKTLSLHIESEKVEIEKIHKIAKDPIQELLLVAKHVLQHLRKIKPNTVFDLKKYYRDAWGLIEEFHQSFVYELMKSNLNEGLKQGIYREGLDADVLAKLYSATGFALVDEGIFPLKDYNRKELFKQFIFYHIHGIASPKGLKLLNKHLSNGNI